MCVDNIIWEEVAKKVGAIDANAHECGASTQMVLEAIEYILGEENLCNAVHKYVRFDPGSEFYRLTLNFIKPWSGMVECYHIYKNNKLLEEKRAAVELLRFICDARAIRWVVDFLRDDDPEIQRWGFAIVEQLYISYNCYEEDIEDIVDIGLSHESSVIRERSLIIKELMNKRQTEE